MNKLLVFLLAALLIVADAMLYPETLGQIAKGNALLTVYVLIVFAAAAFFLAKGFLDWLFGKSKPEGKVGPKRTGLLNDFAEIGKFFFYRKMMLALFAFIATGAFIYTHNPSLFATLMQGLLMVLQLMAYLAFGILQFVAIFWFMSITKKTKIEPGDPKEITLKDYLGQPRLVELARQSVNLLQGRKDFQMMGGAMANGILLEGPPGTGKTFLAKAIAGEAGVAFLGLEGSGFRGMFWGVDTMKVIACFRETRALARKHGAAILFIDEIDAVGMSRGGVSGGGTMGMGGLMGGTSGALTRLLYEMDGVSEPTRFERMQMRFAELFDLPKPKRNWHMMVMGSTNRFDVLDSALLRPGRFDTHIRVDPPDRAGRREIIKGYLSKIRHDASIDVEALVEGTPGYTPVQIMAALTKDAVRIAIFRGAKEVSYVDIDRALEQQHFGVEQPIEEWDPKQREQVAYHEAGHAVVAHHLKPEDRLNRLTIVRHGGALGYLEHLPPTEIYGLPLTDMVRDIRISYAGHVAARIYFGENWTGGSGDFANIHGRLVALAVHGAFGPPLPVTPETLTKLLADEKVQRWIAEQEKEVEMLLRKHWKQVDALAQELLKKERLVNEEILACLSDAEKEEGSNG